MKIGIIVAMDKELDQLSALLHDAHRDVASPTAFTLGHVGPHDVVLQKCGIGKVNAAIGTVEMIRRHHPDLILSSGCAGGADTTLSVGDVVVATETVYHDAYCGSDVAFGQIMGMPPRYAAPRHLVDKALAMPCSTTVRSGLTVSGEWFVDTREKMRAILDRFPDALAVDMESCAIAQVCHVYHVPFLSFRIVSDVPLRDHHAAMYFDFWDRIAQGSFDVTRTFLQTL